MVWSRNRNRIDVLTLVEQPSPVLITPSLRPLLCCFDIAAFAGRDFCHHIAECNQIVTCRGNVDVRPTSAADAATFSFSLGDFALIMPGHANGSVASAVAIRLMNERREEAMVHLSLGLF